MSRDTRHYVADVRITYMHGSEIKEYFIQYKEANLVSRHSRFVFSLLRTLFADSFGPATQSSSRVDADVVSS